MTPRSTLSVPIVGLAVLVGSGLILTPPTGAAVIGRADRLTVAEWAAAKALDMRVLEASYAATGVVTCHWDDAQFGPRTSIASGQVTGRQDLITLSAHTFFDPDTCIAKARPNNCEFTVVNDGVTQTAIMADILGIGFTCGSPPGQSHRDRLINDWAVVRLEHALDVVPYQIPDGLTEVIAQNATVLSVVHSQDYLVIDPDGATRHPKTLSECTIRDVLRQADRVVYFSTDCDGAQRSSGGSVLAGGALPHTLIGVWAAASEGRLLLDAAVERITEAGQYRNDLANTRAYDVNAWSSRHVPVAGAFLQAIRAAVETRVD